MALVALQLSRLVLGCGFLRGYFFNPHPPLVYRFFTRGNLLASPSGMSIGRPCPVFHQLADLMNKLSLFKASLYLASSETKESFFEGDLVDL